MSTARNAVVRLAPYLVTAAVLGAILYRFPVSRIVAEVARGHVLPLVPITLLMMLASLLFVATADHVVVRYACGPLRWFDVVRAKAGCSLLDILNFAAGRGAYAVWIARFTGASAGLAGGTLLYMMAADLAAVGAAAAVACWVAPDVAPDGVVWVAASLSALMVFFVVAGRFRLLTRGRDPAIFRPWHLVPTGAGLAQMGVRLVQQGMFAVATYAGLRAFGVDIPFVVAAVHTPIILFVGAMPLNVGGFGAVTAVWLLMTRWAPGEQLLAFQFLWNLMLAGAIVLRGLPFVRGVVREVDAVATR